MLLAAGAVGAGALLLGAWLSNPSIALGALAGTGLSYGAVSSAYPAATGHFYGAARVGHVYGRLFTAWGAAGLIAPIAAGLAFDLAGNYTIVLLAAGVAAADRPPATAHQGGAVAPTPAARRPRRSAPSRQPAPKPMASGGPHPAGVEPGS